MAKAQHTAGPWGRDGLYVTDANDATIADCGKSHTISRATQRANADLIQSAPDLLAALKAVVEITPAHVGNLSEADRMAYAKAYGAIRKAEGGE